METPIYSVFKINYNFFKKNFIFVDSFYRNIRNKMIINCEYFAKRYYEMADTSTLYSFLADLYLFYVDTEIKKLNKKYDFKYSRYVDDIRIFSKEKLVSQKIIASLDLISRDLGLIPQGSKILIKEITDIEMEDIIPVF